jgi:hypothetical protein
MIVAWRLLPVFLVIGTTAAAAAEEPLGRLFFTPEQRAALKARGQAPDAPPTPIDTVRLDGVVSRSSGKSTVWINGRPQHENAAGNPIRTAVSAQRTSRAKITLDRSAPISLRAGETYDRRTSRVTDVIGAGAIRIHTHHDPTR